MEKTWAGRPLAFHAQNSRLNAMTWRKPLIRSIFRLLHPGVLRELELIKSIEKSSPAAIKNVQRERLQRLLHHAWSTTEYYRDVLEQCGAVRAGTVNLDRFDDIPFLTKDIIRSQGPRLRAKSMPEGRRAY